ncbi:hypothetical protein BYT27DRAFT_7190674 [Phlegmacium glaucopus]|nr:hypothetical protein BYT27DRAFT_7190674 [Phlegmacium glaucopus]
MAIITQFICNTLTESCQANQDLRADATDAFHISISRLSPSQTTRARPFLLGL